MDGSPTLKMNVEINNLQNRHNLHLNHIQELVSELILAAAPQQPLRQWEDISLAIMDDEQIADVNETYVGHEGPTDVITFTYEPESVGPQNYNGEIIVNAQRAYEEGTKRISPDYELAFYLAHACLHLMDLDDETTEKRQHMHTLQDDMLQQPSVKQMLHLGLYAS